MSEIIELIKNTAELIKGIAAIIAPAFSVALVIIQSKIDTTQKTAKTDDAINRRRDNRLRSFGIGAGIFSLLYSMAGLVFLQVINPPISWAPPLMNRFYL